MANKKFTTAPVDTELENDLKGTDVCDLQEQIVILIKEEEQLITEKKMAAAEYRDQINQKKAKRLQLVQDIENMKAITSTSQVSVNANS